MKITRYALHEIASADTSKLGFSASDYSRFKFGCKDIARNFGFALAGGFIRSIQNNLSSLGQIVVISSPYQFIPTATFAMKDYFIQKLNYALMLQQLPVVEEARIYRNVTYREDYGGMSAEERMRLIGNDSFYVDAAFVKGKTVILMDDVYITGSHERMIQGMLEAQSVQASSVYYLYFGQLVNPNVAPQIENDLNYHSVHNLQDVNRIIHNGSFLFNTRVVKYILNADHQEFLTFIHQQDEKFVNTLCHLSIGNSYHNIPQYQDNLGYLLWRNRMIDHPADLEANVLVVLGN